MDHLKEKSGQKDTKWLLASSMALAVLIISVYWPAIWFNFIELDDNLYILENPKIKLGLSMEGITWALTTFHTTNWHPLTWLFMLVEYRFFGLNPAGYHFVGIILHIVNAVLLLIVTSRILGEKWKALMVAALFAVFPLNIESVVWIAELKNLLSTMLWFLTILFYLRYAKNQGLADYLATLALFTLGLTAKPMLVSLPLVFLLLDYWPLKRFSLEVETIVQAVTSGEGKTLFPARLFAEKIPFIILSLLSTLITIYAAQAGGAIKSLSAFPFCVRLVNALLALSSYLWMIIWPRDLSIFYPYSQTSPIGEIAASLFFLAAASGLVILKGKKYRYLAVGWLWYLITIFPVIGIVQVGFQKMANRYAYIPFIGIFIIFTMGLTDILKKFHRLKPFMPVIAVVPVIYFSVCSAFELPHWQNTETAFAQALAVTRNNHIALLGMGNIDGKKGNIKAAEAKFREVLLIKPDYAEAHNNLALLLMKRRQNREAEFHLRKAIKYDPRSAKAHNNLGALLAGEGNFVDARGLFEKAIKLDPDYISARANLSLLMNASR
jgi:hypothetical protein